MLPIDCINIIETGNRVSKWRVIKSFRIMHKLDFKKFAKFFWGVASDKDKDHVYSSEESHEMLKKEWDKSAGQGGQSQFSKKYIYNQIRNQKPSPSKTSQKKRVWVFRAAAMLVLLFAVGSLLYIFSDFEFKSSEKEIVYIEKTTSRGERKQVILPDNSKIWLNAASSITYPETLGENGERTVELEGEAYFQVEKSEELPFIVKTDQMQVKVLGTSFNVRAYPEDESINTLLVEGSVRLLNNVEEEKILKPGELGVYSKGDNSIFVDSDIAIEDKLAWKEGKLVFDNEKFVTVARELERWFDVNINIKDELKGKYRYTMTITDENIREVCTLIKETTPVECKIEGSDVYFFKKQTN